MNITAFVVIALTTGLPAIVSAEGTADDPRWAPWLGCWEMVRENVHEGAAALPDELSSEPPLALVERAAPRVCVARDGVNAVKVTTTLEGQPPLVQTIVADGSQQPLEDSTCRGSQRAEWSKRGARLYSQADVTCEQEVRTVSGLSLIDRDGTWLDIRAVRIGALETTRVGRYRRVTDESASASDPYSPYTLEDVKEGMSRASPRVIEAALVETKAAFRLSSRQLIELADAHVPANVIDLIVALSYPERFVVDRSFRREPIGFSSTDPFFVSPSVYLAGFGVYDDLGFLLFYCSPLSYSHLGLYGSQYFFGNGGLIVTGGGGVPVQPSGTGRVINGVGYTQVRPRDTDNTSGSPTPSSSSGGSSASVAGGGSVSSGGFSSGGAADSGRTAVPR